MVADPSLYGHWMAEYLTKRHKSAFSNYDTTPFDILLNISASNGRRRVYYGSLDSSRRDDSDELKHIFPRPLDAEIFGETSNGAAF
jgi:hypothetical protein